jgi:hypothetical protein
MPFDSRNPSALAVATATSGARALSDASAGNAGGGFERASTSAVSSSLSFFSHRPSGNADRVSSARAKDFWLAKYSRRALLRRSESVSANDSASSPRSRSATSSDERRTLSFASASDATASSRSILLWRSHCSSSRAARVAPSPTACARKRSSSRLCNAKWPSASALRLRAVSTDARNVSFSSVRASARARHFSTSNRSALSRFAKSRVSSRSNPRATDRPPGVPGEAIPGDPGAPRRAAPPPRRAAGGGVVGFGGVEVVPRAVVAADARGGRRGFGGVASSGLEPSGGEPELAVVVIFATGVCVSAALDSGTTRSKSWSSRSRSARPRCAGVWNVALRGTDVPSASGRGRSVACLARRGVGPTRRSRGRAGERNGRARCGGRGCAGTSSSRAPQARGHLEERGALGGIQALKERFARGLETPGGGGVRALSALGAPVDVALQASSARAEWGWHFSCCRNPTRGSARSGVPRRQSSNGSPLDRFSRRPIESRRPTSVSRGAERRRRRSRMLVFSVRSENVHGLFLSQRRQSSKKFKKS